MSSMEGLRRRPELGLGIEFANIQSARVKHFDDDSGDGSSGKQEEVRKWGIDRLLRGLPVSEKEVVHRRASSWGRRLEKNMFGVEFFVEGFGPDNAGLGGQKIGPGGAGLSGQQVGPGGARLGDLQAHYEISSGLANAILFPVLAQVGTNLDEMLYGLTQVVLVVILFHGDTNGVFSLTKLE